MKTSTNSTESTNSTDENSSTGYNKEESKEEGEKVVDDGSPKLDENGYDIVPKEGEKVEDKEEDKKVEIEDDKKIENPATGYGEEESETDDNKEEPKEEDKKTDDKKDDEKTNEEQLKKDIEEAMNDLPEGFNKKMLSEFALKNKFNKDQAKAYVELAKSEANETSKNEELQVKNQRTAWKKELVEDNDFGGENFDKNVDRVEKVLANFMPNTKKVLTERGTMMPPYIMRDLLKLSKALNPTTELVNGEVSKKVESEDGNFLDTMYK